jgi:hypothetical protein
MLWSNFVYENWLKLDHFALLIVSGMSGVSKVKPTVNLCSKSPFSTKDHN